MQPNPNFFILINLRGRATNRAAGPSFEHPVISSQSMLSAESMVKHRFVISCLIW
jgi:hypothetical protein